MSEPEASFPERVRLANPRGFCAGVDRAIDMVELCLEGFGAPVYVRHEVVHNRKVVERLRGEGAIFIEALEDVPDGATLVFSAHGVPRWVQQEAARRGLRVFDATCPLVTKVHVEVARCARDGIDCVLIGHAGHPEVEGTLGQYVGDGGGCIHLVETVDDVARLDVRDPRQLHYVSQTTLSVDETRDIIAALRARFPAIRAPRRDDICYATQNRQDAVRQLATEADVVLVVGSRNSSNSNRLVELARREGVPAHLIDGPEDIDPAWLRGHRTVGLTAGASAPEPVVQQVVGRLRALGAHDVAEAVGVEENVEFGLPQALRLIARSGGRDPDENAA
jgi:4-hydroxy-3-methylbut-2-enyl diphosphate reductase